jgi:acetyltransferase EpsM
MQLYVAGTGSFAAEIVDWATAAGARVLGLLELLDPSRVGAAIHGLPVCDPADVPPGGTVVIGAGGDRRELWRRLATDRWRPASVIHPAAHLARDAAVGAGATIGPRAVVGAGARIGEQAILSRGVLLGHHVAVEAFVTLNPGVNIGGNSTVGAGAFIGMGATIVDGTRIGTDAIVGAGAVVLRDVEAGTQVHGVPAREVPR